jgi:hypothetical protein
MGMEKGTREMNANELADELQELDSKLHLINLFKASTMLRQQQAEIEALKKEAALQRLSDFTQEAESFDRTVSHTAGKYVFYNKPYIWMDDLGTWFTNEDYQNLDNKDKKGIFPLYIHLAKTLTDEQIESAWFKVFKPESGIGKNITNGVYEFARLIRESE